MTQEAALLILSHSPIPQVRGRSCGFQDSQEAEEWLCVVNHLPCEPKDLGSVPRNCLQRAGFHAMTL